MIVLRFLLIKDINLYSDMLKRHEYDIFLNHYLKI